MVKLFFSLSNCPVMATRQLAVTNLDTVATEVTWDTITPLRPIIMFHRLLEDISLLHHWIDQILWLEHHILKTMDE